MKTELTLSERYAVMNLLPVKTNFTTLGILRKLQNDLSPSEEEIKLWEISSYVTPKGGLRTKWNKEGKEALTEIEVGETAQEIIVAELERLDKANELTQDHYTVYEKFIDVAVKKTS